MDPTAVNAAFEMLLEEVEGEIDHITSEGARAFDTRDFETVRESLEKVAKVTSVREKIALIREEWLQLRPEDVDAGEPETSQAARRDLGRLGRGLRTPEKEFVLPILQTLVELGGGGSVAEVLERVHRLMADRLLAVDHEPLRSDNSMLRWRNTAQWARNTMVNDGLLKKDSRRGVWEISDVGRRFLASSSH